MELKLQKGDFYVGITCDDNFYILKEDTIIGKACINLYNEEKVLTIEWVELKPEYRGKKYFRSILKALKEHYQAKAFRLDCSDEYLSMYEHLGARKIGYDEDREMYELMLDV